MLTRGRTRGGISQTHKFKRKLFRCNRFGVKKFMLNLVLPWGRVPFRWPSVVRGARVN